MVQPAGRLAGTSLLTLSCAGSVSPLGYRRAVWKSCSGDWLRNGLLVLLH